MRSAVVRRAVARWRNGPVMAEFLVGAAGFVLAMVALGLVRVLRGPADAVDGAIAKLSADLGELRTANCPAP